MLGEVFDPQADFLIREHWRPHWSQSGAVTFITFRTHDSIPKDVIRRWDEEKRHWLIARGYASAQHWSQTLITVSRKDRTDFENCFQRHREEFLDTCHGRCLLRRPDLARMVADTLLYFDGQRYEMGDFVIMPNHVHLLAVFHSADNMKTVCDSLLHFTARQINQATEERGRFWQQEPFDHLVRSSEQYEYLRKYIAENPQKARLKPGEYIYRRLPDK